MWSRGISKSDRLPDRVLYFNSRDFIDHALLESLDSSCWLSLYRTAHMRQFKQYRNFRPKRRTRRCQCCGVFTRVCLYIHPIPLAFDRHRFCIWGESRIGVLSTCVTYRCPTSPCLPIVSSDWFDFRVHSYLGHYGRARSLPISDAHSNASRI